MMCNFDVSARQRKKQPQFRWNIISTAREARQRKNSIIISTHLQFRRFATQDMNAISTVSQFLLFQNPYLNTISMSLQFLQFHCTRSRTISTKSNFNIVVGSNVPAKMLSFLEKKSNFFGNFQKVISSRLVGVRKKQKYPELSTHRDLSISGVFEIDEIDLGIQFLKTEP